MNDNGVERRGFLKAAAMAAGLSVVPAAAVRVPAANSKIEVGVMGCGGRGGWLAGLFEESANAKVVAVHDYFRKRADSVGEKQGVDASRRYVGLDGYRQMLADGVDAVAIISPPYFHPDQVVAALDAGVHVFLAKPIAVDVPGCTAIMDAAKQAEGKLSVLVDFQTRANEFFQGAAQRVHDGVIGEPATGQASYHCARLGIKTAPGTETARMRNWVFDKALSGDIIVEQNIHVLDVMNWYLQAHPLTAFGTGGRKVRVDVGDCWDHFLVNYTYPNDVHVAFDSRQFGDGYSDLGIRLFGSLGTVDSHYGGDVRIRGKRAGWAGGKTNSIYKDGAVTNIQTFCSAIESGQHINNAEEAAHSTMTSILGRMAAYQNRVVTWDEMIEANERLDAKLDLPDDGAEWWA